MAFVNLKIDKLTRGTGNGDVSTSMHNLIAGKNWSGGRPYHKPIRDKTGMVFLTVADCNLATENVAMHRTMLPFVTPNRRSMGSVIRSMLDHRGAMTGMGYSDLVDPHYPFFSLLDNTVLTLDGWPDYVTNTWASDPLLGGTVLIAPEGRIAKGQDFSLSATHINVEGDMINQTYSAIQQYIDLLMTDQIRSYNVNVANDRYDFAMRWFRFAFDSTGTRVCQFTMCGYGFPIAGSQGAVMGYDAKSKHNEGYAEISASWKCMGVFHNDPIVIDEFNKTVVHSQPLMADGEREEHMQLVGDDNEPGSKVRSAVTPSMAAISPFQYHGYPRIHPTTLIFEVWVRKEEYRHIMEGLDGEDVITAISTKATQDFKEGVKGLDTLQKSALFSNLKDKLPGGLADKIPGGLGAKIPGGLTDKLPGGGKLPGGKLDSIKDKFHL